jgi:hypothetical protein
LRLLNILSFTSAAELSNRYPAAHNGLVAGSNPAEKIARSWTCCSFVGIDDYEAIEKGANRFARYVF